MSKQAVLICGELVWAQKEFEDAFKQKYDLLQLDAPDRATFFKQLASKEYSNLVAIYRHNNSAGPIGIFDADLIEHLPQSVKYICHNGAGYDQIDINAATKRGIQVSHTPEAVDAATATVAMYLILSSLRQFWIAENTARAGKFKEGTKPANDPEDKVLGIVGMGGIGRALAKRALGFDMKVQYHNRNPVDRSLLSQFPEGSIKYVSTLDELLATSDVVSLNLPLNKNTEKFFGKKQFSAMKRGAVLINTARGGVVDEEAMLEALESGQLGSAGLDVFPDEPHINPALLKNDRISILPHMGTETQETQKKMEMLVLANIQKALEGGHVLNLVQEQRGRL